MSYLVVIEQGDESFGAYVPDLPGCAAVGATKEEALRLVREAIALHLEQPHGSPRNTWPTTVAAVEPLGEVTRVTVSDPPHLGVDITPDAASSLGLAPGVGVWASVKATEITVNPT